MRIPTEKLNEVSQANNIVDVISQYIPVKKKGKTFVALCPFHPDKNPSLHISQEKQVFFCFGCKKGGNVFRFVQDYEKISFNEAVLKLAERVGIKIAFKKGDVDISNEISKLYEINKIAAKYFYNNLLNIKGSEKDFLNEYFKVRKIKKNTIVKFGLGYASRGWNNLSSYFLDNTDFTIEDLRLAGLVKINEKGSFYDTFRGRLIFPIFNENDKVVGFGARKLFEDDEIEGKYINTQETKIYQKRQILYGLNFAKDSIRAKDFVLIVEGYFDLISLSQAGINNVVATSGTALTLEQLKLLSRYTQNIILNFDSDIAGVKASKAGIQLILETGMNLNIITLPENQDPDSFINIYGKDEFEKLINKKVSFIDFVSSVYKKENKLNTAEEKTEFIKEIISFIVRIPDKIKRAFYIKEISTKYGLYESDLRDELEKSMKTYRKETSTKSASSFINTNKKLNKESEIQKVESDLIELFIHGTPEAVEYLVYNVELDFIENEIVYNIICKFLDEYTNEGKIDVAKITNDLDDEKAIQLISEKSVPRYDLSEYDDFDRHTLIFSVTKKNIDYLKAAKDLIKKFKIVKIRKEIEELKKKGNHNGILQKQKEIKEIQKSED
ncbi:MAG: DNA primase [Ignavibacteria bacterium]|nr:DNA primase [Ignavibacteria bacterium]